MVATEPLANRGILLLNKKRKRETVSSQKTDISCFTHQITLAVCNNYKIPECSGRNKGGGQAERRLSYHISDSYPRTHSSEQSNNAPRALTKVYFFIKKIGSHPPGGDCSQINLGAKQSSSSVAVTWLLCYF